MDSRAQSVRRHGREQGGVSFLIQSPFTCAALRCNTAASASSSYLIIFFLLSSLPITLKLCNLGTTVNQSVSHSHLDVRSTTSCPIISRHFRHHHSSSVNQHCSRSAIVGSLSLLLPRHPRDKSSVCDSAVQPSAWHSAASCMRQAAGKAPAMHHGGANGRDERRHPPLNPDLPLSNSITPHGSANRKRTIPCPRLPHAAQAAVGHPP